MLPRNYNSNPSINNPDIDTKGIQYMKDTEASYGEHIKNVYAMCNSSATHTYGNVLSVVERYLLDGFPADLFKTITASTTLASRQVNRLPNKLYKKEVPMMVLVPRIVFGQGDDRFLGNTLINSRMNNIASQWGNGSLLELAHDRKTNIYINGHYNRALMYVDVILVFNTYSEQMNWMNHLYNVFSIGHNQFIRAPLELYIPNTFCELISKLTDIPVKNDKGSVYEFSRYMNQSFYHPITYKLDGGTNKDEFFMYYIADLDVLLTEPQAGTGVKDGQIRRNFDITFTVRCEFNTIGYFMLNSPQIEKPIILDGSDNESIIPIFSDVINLDDFVLPEGWTILSWPIFKLGEKENSISIESLLNDSLKTVIDYHLQNGIPMESFINIQFRENGQILDNESYWIDWSSRILYLSNPDQHRTYRLIISVSNVYINELIKKIYNFE